MSNMSQLLQIVTILMGVAALGMGVAVLFILFIPGQELRTGLTSQLDQVGSRQRMQSSHSSPTIPSNRFLSGALSGLLLQRQILVGSHSESCSPDEATQSVINAEMRELIKQLSVTATQIRAAHQEQQGREQELRDYFKELRIRQAELEKLFRESMDGQYGLMSAVHETCQSINRNEASASSNTELLKAILDELRAQNEASRNRSAEVSFGFAPEIIIRSPGVARETGAEAITRILRQRERDFGLWDITSPIVYTSQTWESRLGSVISALVSLLGAKPTHKTRVLFSKKVTGPSAIIRRVEREFGKEEA